MSLTDENSPLKPFQTPNYTLGEKKPAFVVQEVKCPHGHNVGTLYTSVPPQLYHYPAGNFPYCNCTLYAEQSEWHWLKLKEQK
jgi:hypothetical protein